MLFFVLSQQFNFSPVYWECFCPESFDVFYGLGYFIAYEVGKVKTFNVCMSLSLSLFAPCKSLLVLHVSAGCRKNFLVIWDHLVLLL